MPGSSSHTSTGRRGPSGPSCARRALVAFRGALAALLLASLATLARADEATWETDRAALLDGVQVIESEPGSVPGPVLAYGPAFPVVVGEDAGLRLPVVTAARWDAGRVVAFGHGAFLAPTMLESTSTQTGTFVRNAVRWVASDASTLGGLRIGVNDAPHLAGLASWLAGEGAEVVTVTPASIAATLPQLDVLVWNAWLQPQSERGAIASFVRGGGGLIVDSLAWGWLQLNPTLDIRQHAGNELLAAAGILWTDGYSGRTAANGYDALSPPPAATQASEALAALTMGLEELAIDEIKQATHTLTRAIRTLPDDDGMLRPMLEDLNATIGPVVPSEEAPLTLAGHPLERLALTLQIEDLRRAPAEQVWAHPAAASFPGEVPAAAPRVTRTLHIDTAQTRWHSTGLYAAPGEALTVSVAAPLANARLAVRIGPFTDELWSHESWKRAPAITLRRPIDAPVVTVASAFGGPVYVEVPDSAGLGVVDVAVAGAVEAPYFRTGEVSVADWLAEQRDKPAPWAEIGSDKLFITVPAAAARGLDDPERLMAFWDGVLDAQADLAARPRARAYPERFVADRQHCCGYMHAGYPIMTFLDVQDLVLDEPRLRLEASWGHYHELGHNHQSSDWTFAGTGEVTVNLFTLYALEVVNGYRVGEPPPSHITSFTPGAIDAVWQAYDAAGRSFEIWKSDPFLALAMYAHLAWGFGWDAYRDVFAEYRALSPAERPTTDDEKRDQWLVRMSRRVGHDLSMLFDVWGVPVSSAAREQVAGLPPWADVSCYPAPDGAACDDGLACTLDACDGVACKGAPAPRLSCKQAVRPRSASIDLRDRTQGRLDSLRWTWRGGDATSPDELGDPRLGDQVTLCIFDDREGTPRLALEVPGPASPLLAERWVEIRSGVGFRYRDPRRSVRGVSAVDLIAGAAGRARAQLVARGPLLLEDDSTLPLGPNVVVQLVTENACFESRFSTPHTSSAQRFHARSD